MQTEIHHIKVLDSTTPELAKATDELFEVIEPELKKDEELNYKFKAFYDSKLTGENLVLSFAKIVQPKVAQLANSLEHRLTLPLYASLAWHISNRWVDAKDAEAKPSEEVVIDERQDVMEKIAAMPTPTLEQALADFKDVAPAFVAQKGKAAVKQDRSKPVLTVKVLRGFHNLADKLDISTHGHSQAQPSLTKGNPDLRAALDYITRVGEWAENKGKI